MDIERAWSSAVRLVAEENCHLINPERRELLCDSIDVLWNRVYTPIMPEEICNILGIDTDKKRNIAAILGTHTELGYFGIERKIVKLISHSPDPKTRYVYNPDLAERLEKAAAETAGFDEIKKTVLENEDAFVEISNRQMRGSGQHRLYTAKQIFENGIGRYVFWLKSYNDIYETNPMGRLKRR